MVRFDDSLPRLCSIAAKHVGGEVLARSAVIREAAGRLSLVLAKELDPSALDAFSRELREALGRYARQDRVVSDLREPGANQLLLEAMSQPSMTVERWTIHLLDRRVVGADWLRSPASTDFNVPRIVFPASKAVSVVRLRCALQQHICQGAANVFSPLISTWKRPASEQCC